MIDYATFGKEMLDYVQDNLDKLFTEEHLKEQLRQVKEVDPDRRGQQIMKTIEDYYLKLEKLFVLYIKGSAVKSEIKVHRPEFLNIFFLNFEKRLKGLIEKLETTKEDKIDGFRGEVKKFFVREYFHNFHFFLSLIYKE